jgi:hypothetical protein
MSPRLRSARRRATLRESPWPLMIADSLWQDAASPLVPCLCDSAGVLHSRVALTFVSVANRLGSTAPQVNAGQRCARAGIGWWAGTRQSTTEASGPHWLGSLLSDAGDASSTRFAARAANSTGPEALGDRPRYPARLACSSAIRSVVTRPPLASVASCCACGRVGMAHCSSFERMHVARLSQTQPSLVAHLIMMNDGTPRFLYQA